MMNILSKIPLINGLLFSGALGNEATDGLVTEVLKVDSLELLATIAVLAAVKYGFEWVKRRIA